MNPPTKMRSRPSRLAVFAVTRIINANPKQGTHAKKGRRACCGFAGFLTTWMASNEFVGHLEGHAARAIAQRSLNATLSTNSVKWGCKTLSVQRDVGVLVSTSWSAQCPEHIAVWVEETQDVADEIILVQFSRFL